jgi:predicted enzyme related to lactoylglutathione lyase
MPPIEKHTPGMLCWADVTTTDLKSTSRFYGELFGWEIAEMPDPSGGIYAMTRKRGFDVAAIGYQPDHAKRQGPPHWNSYFAVTDVDAAAKKVTQAGGKLIAPPFDVLDAGRMAVAQDPGGAIFSLWQPMKHRGAGLVGEPGTLCWTELATTNV